MMTQKEMISKAAVRWTFFTVVALFFIALMYVAYRSDQADEHISQNTDGVAANLEEINKIVIDLQTIVKEQCVESQAAATGINEVLDALIQGAVESNVFTPAEKSTRLTRYRAAKQKIPVC